MLDDPTAMAEFVRKDLHIQLEDNARPGHVFIFPTFRKML